MTGGGICPGRQKDTVSGQVTAGTSIALEASTIHILSAHWSNHSGNLTRIGGGWLRCPKGVVTLAAEKDLKMHGHISSHTPAVAYEVSEEVRCLLEPWAEGPPTWLGTQTSTCSKGTAFRSMYSERR